ncbi:MAG: 4-hydroxy-tetrahydrodipicolinate reductase [Bacteroidales bacterium]|nr:4-hydroxy-tetrahydrodipicolinate reductase [Bacteroidales bacterium]
MNIALIGYGRMGHEIGEAALKRGHVIKIIIDEINTADLNPLNFKEVDVAIEFSVPGSAFRNITKCFEMRVPVVSGTTGWLHDYDKAARLCIENGTSFIHSANFSIGVNIFFRLNSDLAGLIERYEDYKPSIEEIHHVRKLDAPSGTAITLAKAITTHHSQYRGWISGEPAAANMVPLHSVREGNVPGTHIVAWSSEIDTIVIRHEAKSRKGFALGAVIAAEYISGRKGVFTMDDVLGF